MLFPNIWHFTDAGNASIFVKLYGDKVRYDHTRGCWLIWNGSFWQKDNTDQIKRYAFEISNYWYRTASTLDTTSGTDRTQMIKWAKESEANQRMNSTLKITSVLEPISSKLEDFNNNPWLLACANGVLNLETGEFRSGMSDDMISISTNIIYDSNAKAPRWLRFLDEIFCGDATLIDYIHRFCGYTATGFVREQSFAILHG